MTKKTAAFVGRFQPFHAGHFSIVESILNEYDYLILIIGSANISRTTDNPWTIEEREEIIRASLTLEMQEKIDIVGLDDIPDDNEWGKNLKNLIQHGTLFTGNDWVRDICHEIGIETQWIPSYHIDISGTRIRQMQRDGEDVSKWTMATGIPA